MESIEALASMVTSKTFKITCLHVMYSLCPPSAVLLISLMLSTHCGVHLALKALKLPLLSSKHVSDTGIVYLDGILFGAAVYLLGPLRVFLLTEIPQQILLLLRNTIKSGDRVRHVNRTRGLLCFTIMIFILFVLDFDSAAVLKTEDNIGNHHQQHHSKYPINHPIIHHIFLHAGISDHKLGVILAVVYSSLKSQIRPGVYEPSKIELCTCLAVSTLIWLSIIFAQSSFSTAISTILSLGTVVSVFWLAHGFARSLIMTKSKDPESRNPKQSLIIAFSIYPILLSLFTTFFIADSERHPLSSGALIAIALFIIGIRQFSRPSSKNRGHFVGYSESGVPLFNLESGYVFYGQRTRFLETLKNGMEQILTHSDSRRIFYFLCLNLAFTFVEMAYGVWTNSLGLLSDGFHMLFDCSALVMGLYASIMSKWKPNEAFPYGYGRVEVLSGFVNGLFLSIIGFSVFVESLMRLYYRPEVKTERLLLVSVAGLIVNLVGVMSFSHAHSHHGHNHSEPKKHTHGHSHNTHCSSGHNHAHEHQHCHNEKSHQISIGGSHGHSHSISSMDNANMKGVFLHVLADTLGSVGVIISSILIDKFGYFIADSICSLFISITILASVTPLLIESSRTLMLRVPNQVEHKLRDLREQLLCIEGVEKVEHASIWSQSSNELIGLVNISATQSGINVRENCESLIRSFMNDEASKFNVRLQITESF